MANETAVLKSIMHGLVILQKANPGELVRITDELQQIDTTVRRAIDDIREYRQVLADGERDYQYELASSLSSVELEDFF